MVPTAWHKCTITWLRASVSYQLSQQALFKFYDNKIMLSNAILQDLLFFFQCRQPKPRYGQPTIDWATLLLPLSLPHFESYATLVVSTSAAASPSTAVAMREMGMQQWGLGKQNRGQCWEVFVESKSRFKHRFLSSQCCSYNSLLIFLFFAFLFNKYLLCATVCQSLFWVVGVQQCMKWGRLCTHGAYILVAGRQIMNR